MKEPWQDQYYEIAHTETINDTLNPQFVTKIICNYNFETIQKIRFEVLEKDMQSSDFLGFFETTLSDLVSFSGRQFVGKLTGIPNKDCGEIIIVTEELSHCKQLVEIEFCAKNLPKLSKYCSNDPFLAISRSNEDGSYSAVAKSEKARSSQNPTWKPITIRVITLCSKYSNRMIYLEIVDMSFTYSDGDLDRSIKIDVYDQRISGNHKIIGTCYTSLRGLNEQGSTPMVLVNEEKHKIDPTTSAAGTLTVQKVTISEDITFLDYIRNGTQMHFAVAIDFTASNGRFSHPSSLHYLSPEKLNSYEIAIRGVGEIIQHYDSSQLFPAFGKLYSSFVQVQIHK